MWQIWLMQEGKERRVLVRAVWITAVAIAALLTCACGCSDKSDGVHYVIPESSEGGESAPESEVLMPEIETGAADDEDDASAAALIETCYGTLRYPVQWAGPLEVVRTVDGDAVTVTFRASVRDVRYDLFDITIGKEDGEKIGNLTDENGVSHPVYARMCELVFPDDMTDEEKNRLYAMQEGLNFLGDHLE